MEEYQGKYIGDTVGTFREQQYYAFVCSFLYDDVH